MLIRYREYVADIKFSWEDCLFHGASVGMHTKLFFEGKSVDAATQDFRRAVNEYLSDCVNSCVTPEVPYAQRRRVHVEDKLCI